MGRVALTKTKLIIITLALIVLALGGAGLYATHSSTFVAKTVTNGQHKLTQISYQGQKGVDALTLLEKHAAVQVKHYSFGDLVTSIDGSAGNGPQYWTFYIDGKQAAVGAGAYQTKDSDTISWKLQ